MPSVLHQPRLTAIAYRLRTPAAPIPLSHEDRPVYNEEQMRAACEAAERRGQDAARAEFEEIRGRLEEETRRAVGRAADVARSLGAERQRVLESAADDVVGLALRIARKVLRRETEVDGAVILPLVRELLQRSAAQSSILVRLSPVDHAFLLAHADRLPEASGIEGLRLRSDTGIEPGGCVVETEAGSLDGTIDTQMERIEEALRGPGGER